MTELTKDRREELRLELSEGAPGMSEVSLIPDELRALLDMADERDRYRSMLERIAAGPRRDSVTQCQMAQEALNGSQS